MTEGSGVHISDSVVMGDVQQNIANTCPTCHTTNIPVMICKKKGCKTQFCEYCHRRCRYSKGKMYDFNSGYGTGPFCKSCMSKKIRDEKLKNFEKRRAALNKKAQEAARKAEEKRINEKVEAERKEKEREEWRRIWKGRGKKFLIGYTIFIFIITGLGIDLFLIFGEDVRGTMNLNDKAGEFMILLIINFLFLPLCILVFILLLAVLFSDG